MSIERTAAAEAPRRGMRNAMRLGLIAAGGAGLAGCVSLKAPDKPIEINLNISIKQEVLYRLDSQAKSLIQQQPGIF